MTPERIDAALIREAVRVQRARTLLDVRDAIDRIPVYEPGRTSASYDRVRRTAEQFRTDLVAALKALDSPRDH